MTCDGLAPTSPLIRCWFDLIAECTLSDPFTRPVGLMKMKAKSLLKGKSLLVVLFAGLSPGLLAGQDVQGLGRSCNAGDMQSCDDLGIMYEGGARVTRDAARAVNLFQQACDGGLMLACTHLGLVLQRDDPDPDVIRDVETAAFLYERACDGGETLGCANLGVSYERGDGVIQDQARAVRLYEQACGDGQMLGCSNLGSMYRTGRGVAVDLGAAASLYFLACAGGTMVSCVNLAVSYERGDGVPEDVATAVSLYLRACEGGVTMACQRVGVTLEPAVRVAATDGFTRVGWVVDTDTNLPLSEAIVDLVELGIRVITDESGRVELPDLPTGRHRLFVERVGYERMEGDLDIPDTRGFQLPLDRTTLGDQSAPGRVVGRVVEGGREFGVADVDITMMTSPAITTLSDSQGRFSLTDVETGLVEVRFQRLGYAARTATVIVQPDKTIEIAATMSARPIELDPITVVVRSRTLERAGFYQRANSSAGTRLTREDLVEMNVIYISDIFVRLPGVRVEDGVVVGRQTFFGTTCALQIFLDGLPMEGWNFDTIPPEYLEAMEVYQGLSVPIQYGPACGVVLFWT